VKEGDIVYHSSGSICNGRYGCIQLALGDLMVVDNEGALDMPVANNREDLTIVGNIDENPELLDTWAEGDLNLEGCLMMWSEVSA